MALTLNIFCNVERLGPIYDADWVHFSINLTAALSPDAGTVLTRESIRKFLALWEWEWSNLMIRGIKRGLDGATDMSFPIESAEMVIGGLDPFVESAGDGTPDGPEADVTRAIRQALQEELDRLCPPDAAVGFDPGLFLGEITSASEAIKVSDNSRSAGEPSVPWRAILGQAWNYPAPLPILAKLAHFFRIRPAELAALQVGEIVAAPVFDKKPFGVMVKPDAVHEPCDIGQGDGLETKSITTEPRPDEPRFYSWRYADTAEGIAVVAFQRECPVEVAAPDPGVYSNLKKLWVEVPPDAIQLEKDWTTAFSSGLADFLDMPRLLLEALRLMNNGGLPELAIRIDDDFVDAFVAALRDRAHSGLYSPPDGESLATYVVRKVLHKPALDPVVETKVAFLKSREPNQNEWKHTLERVLSKALGIAAAKVIPSPASTSPVAFEHALERAYSAISDQATLVAMVFEQWNAAFNAAVDGSEMAEFWRGNKDAVRDQLADLDLRKRLALGTSGIAWRQMPGISKPAGLNGAEIPASLDTVAGIEKACEQRLVEYFEGRFDAPAPTESPYQAYLPRAGRISEEIDPASHKRGIRPVIEKLAQNFVLAEIVEQSTTDGNGRTLEPEKLAFQIDRVQRDVAEQDTPTDHDHASDQKDFVRNMAGVIGLLRRATGPWRCLNHARVLTKRGEIPFTTPPVVALGNGYRNGLRQSIIEYRNEPLVGQTLSSGLARRGAFVPVDRDASTRAPLLSFANAYGRGLKLDSLGYSLDYEGAIAIVSTAGALPKEAVRRTDDAERRAIPWALALPAADADLDLPPLSPIRQPRRLRRRIAIGPLAVGADRGLRFPEESAPQPLQKISVPPIPARVAPIARVLGNAGVGAGEDDPLLLLRPPVPAGSASWVPGFDESYRFALFPPSVSVKVWEIWTAAQPDRWDTAKRASVLAAYSRRTDLDPELPMEQQNRETRTTRSGSEAPGVALDDPATTHLLVRARPVWPAAYETEQRVFEFPAPTGTLGLDLARSSGIAVTLHSLGPMTAEHTHPISANPELTEITISVPEGQVWRVELRSMVAPSLRDRFASGVIDQEEGTSENALRLLVEVPTAFDPRKDYAPALSEAILFGEGEETTGQIEVKLRPSETPGPEAEGFWPFVSRVETLVQRWRWDGRPIILPVKKEPADSGDEPFVREPVQAEPTQRITGDPSYRIGFPFDLIAGVDVDLDGTLGPLDAVLFASRENGDHLVAPAQASFLGPDGQLLFDAPTAGAQATLGHLVHRERLGDSAGALYFRFGVRAFSRYEGLLLNRRSIDSRATRDDAAGDQWRRRVVRCRYRSNVPPPMIKLIVPLTNTMDWGDPTPGLLVVLDEGAYQDRMAGLAEQLESDIVRAALPDEPTQSLYELGPDPILNMDDRSSVGEDVEQLPMVGPVGYTFDTGTAAPLIDRASFLWRTPLVDGEVVDLSNYFVKLRFRRRIIAEGHVNPESGEPLLTSRWTDGIWARMLAPANKATIERQGVRQTVNTSELRFDTATLSVRLKSAPTESILVKAPEYPRSRLHFTIYALLTQVVPDALGSRDRDAYVAFVPLERLSPNLDIKNLKKADRIRLVEIAHLASYNPLTEDLETIFGALIPLKESTDPPIVTSSGSLEEPNNPKAMITRVSPPIVSL